jgi:hypothetical protein
VKSGGSGIAEIAAARIGEVVIAGGSKLDVVAADAGVFVGDGFARRRAAQARVGCGCRVHPAVDARSTPQAATATASPRLAHASWRLARDMIKARHATNNERVVEPCTRDERRELLADGARHGA